MRASLCKLLGVNKNVMEEHKTYAGGSYCRRVAALEAKQDQPQGPQKGLVKSQSQMDSRYHGLSKEDRVIAERLERLKMESKPSESTYSSFLPAVILNRVQGMDSQPCFYTCKRRRKVGSTRALFHIIGLQPGLMQNKVSPSTCYGRLFTWRGHWALGLLLLLPLLLQEAQLYLFV